MTLLPIVSEEDKLHAHCSFSVLQQWLFTMLMSHQTAETVWATQGFLISSQQLPHMGPEGSRSHMIEMIVVRLNKREPVVFPLYLCVTVGTEEEDWAFQEKCLDSQLRSPQRQGSEQARPEVDIVMLQSHCSNNMGRRTCSQPLSVMHMHCVVEFALKRPALLNL